jgi:hypothetical protein
LSYATPPFAPVAPLEYVSAYGYRQARPGIVTAVAILSIIVGSISGLSSIGGIFSGVAYLVMSSGFFPSPAMTVTATSTSSTTTIRTSSGSTVTVRSSAPTTMPVFGPGTFRVDPGASILTIVEASLSIVAAILLIVGGVKLLHDSPGAWRLHRIYIVAKIPLVFVAGFAQWWVYTGLMSNMSTAFGPGSPPPPGGKLFMALPAAMSALIAMVYPVALIIVMCTRSVKDYIAAMRPVD